LVAKFVRLAIVSSDENPPDRRGADGDRRLRGTRSRGTDPADEAPVRDGGVRGQRTELTDPGIQGRLELLIEPNGTAFAATRRQIFTDFERTGPLTREQLVELAHRVDAWTLKDENPPPVRSPTASSSMVTEGRLGKGKTAASRAPGPGQLPADDSADASSRLARDEAAS
jgi:hypothetical protein